MIRKTLVAMAVGSALTVAGWAWAQQGPPPPPPTGGMGPGMMGQPGGMAPGHWGGHPGPREGWGAPGRGMGWGPGPYQPLLGALLRLRQPLGLSDPQVQQLRTLRTEFLKEAIKQSAEIRLAQVDLATLLEANPPDLAKVEAQVKQIAALQGALRFARIKAGVQGRAVLSPEQWQKFESLASQMGPWGPHGGPWRHGGHHRHGGRRHKGHGWRHKEGDRRHGGDE